MNKKKIRYELNKKQSNFSGLDRCFLNLPKGSIVTMNLPAVLQLKCSHRIGENLSKDADEDFGTITEERIELPKLYKVVLLNDDYTPMEFVILVLKRFFGHEETKAHQIMLDVHKNGSGLAGIFILEIAEMKVMQVNQFARLNKFPLKSIMEPEA